MSLLGLFKGKGPSGFGYNSTSAEVTEGVDLTGRTYLVTGCNSGLGLETMQTLSRRGATVIAAARTEQKAIDAGAGLERIVPVACELSEPESVRAAVATVIAGGHSISGIIANAGIMALPEKHVAHGVELQLLTNHFGHFILITGLLDQLTDDGRVVMLSSAGHAATYAEGVRVDDLDASRGYGGVRAYGQSKLANLLFARELSKRLPKPGQTANAVHPGVIVTNLGRHMNKALIATFDVLGPVFATKSIPQGAATSLYVAVNPGAASVSGEYWADSNVTKSSRHGRDEDLARRLWEATEAKVAEL